MKLRTLSSAAIVAALTIGALSPVATYAAPEELDSTGTVTVEEGGDEEIPGTLDPEKEGEKLPEPDTDGPDENINENLGALMIEKTTDLEFGTIKTSANDVTAYAAPMSFNGGADTRGAYVQWRDIRAGGTFGYTVTAELTQQFTGASSNTLAGSTIDFSNGIIAAQGDNTNVVPSNVATAFQLSEDGGAKPVVTADKDAEEGKGRYIIAYGQSDDSEVGTPGTAAESVKLTVPATTASNMAIDTYTAKVTWKVVAAE